MKQSGQSSLAFSYSCDPSTFSGQNDSIAGQLPSAVNSSFGRPSCLSGENYTEDFMIGIFHTRTMAEETAAYYLCHVRGFCEYPCTYIITEKEIMDAQDEIPDEVFMVHGWDMNENMDEIDIVESSCFVSEAHANAELERMKIAQPRTEWIINRWRIDQAQWQEGFERV